MSTFFLNAYCVSSIFLLLWKLHRKEKASFCLIYLQKLVLKARLAYMKQLQAIIRSNINLPKCTE